MFGTNKSVPFVFYTPNNYVSFCYNTLCPVGSQLKPIVLLSAAVPLGVPFRNDRYSTYGNEKFVSFEGENDFSGQWFVWIDGVKIGVYPPSNFGLIGPNYLPGGANVVTFGGEAGVLPSANTSPAMGNGIFATKEYAATQQLISITVGGAKFNPLLGLDPSDPACYTVRFEETDGILRYGGPGCSR